MSGLEVAVLIGVLLVVGGSAAARLHLPAPLVLLGLGLGLGFVPALRSVELPPDVVLLLFLPALLYWECLNLSGREIRRNLRTVLLNAIPLVLVTVAAVAALSHAAALPWAVAITVGAVVAPTDATAVTAVAGPLPRRTRTVLRAESLINDGTALAVYAIAVAAVSAAQPLRWWGGALSLLLAYGGGIVIGVVIAVMALLARRLVRGTPVLENTVSVLTPFAAYLPAQLVHASGVIAVVTCGLVISQAGPRTISAETRTQGWSFWQLTSWILNGTLFLLVGFEAHRAVEGIAGDLSRVVRLGVLTTVVVIGVRIIWITTVPYLIRAVDRRAAQRARRVPLRQRAVTGWAGFRGAVSLSAALALPVGPGGFADRDMLVAVTLIVVLATLLIQGLTLPAVVRWARLPPDPTERDEERLAERTALDAGLAAIPSATRQLQVPVEVAQRVEREYHALKQRFIEAPESRPAIAAQDAEYGLRRAIIAAKRQAIIGLRDSDDIDDIVLRRFQTRLDIEDLRLNGDRAE
jgi:Na+/H+ antiporter